MAKTEMILETFIALIHAVAFKKSQLAESMVWYRSPRLRLLKELDECLFGEKRDETVRKILSFPNIDKIANLEPAERDLLHKLEGLSIEKFVKDYKVTSWFYESHIMPYNKMRHGMSVLLAMKSDLGKNNFAIDARNDILPPATKKGMPRPPPNLISVDGPFPFGNVVAIVPCDERSLNLYEKLAWGWDLYVRYIVGSLLANVFNSGEGYLPCVIRSQGLWSIGYDPLATIMPNEQPIFDHLLEKMKPNFRIPEFKSKIEFSFGKKTDAQIQEKVEKFYSATLLYTGEGNEASSEVFWKIDDSDTRLA